MADENNTPLAGFDRFLSRLPLAAFALIAVGILAGVGAGGYYAYQTYDYVQHDNDFCMSCHLMEQPYEQFGQSAHRGLGCKACHQPTLIARTQMALTQVVENPEDISVHAEVPNERCAGCHIEGNPEEWRLIANSVGHRVHMESSDSVLQGLQCVECHSTSVHEFSPVDRTCAQSQCHVDSTIQLGGMSDLTIHCAACHSFVAPIAAAAIADAEETGAMAQGAVDAAILPDREQCFSCHVMRTLAQMPNPDPHGGVCASCHNPHTQEIPSEAYTSCATAGCHSEADAISGFHRGLQPGILEDCAACHQAHDFSANGDDCVNCHTGIMEDDMSVPGMSGAGMRFSPPDTSGAELASLLLEPSASPLANLTGFGVGWWVHAPAAPQQEQPQFRHSQHRDVSCGNCHSNTESHGGLIVRTLNDCRDCHHAEPVANSCVRCHESSDMPSQQFQAVRDVSFSVGRAAQRTLTFEHGPHEDLDCASCHTEGNTRSAVDADCASCHEDHHDPENQCVSCHQAAPVSAHPPSEAHVTCSGSGCHSDVPFDAVPRTRQVCLGCHQNRQDHRPGRVCAECHALPDPRPMG
jgi:nitrate/TMAO reductase-like tetraheme cytochrome c subunit